MKTAWSGIVGFVRMNSWTFRTEPHIILSNHFVGERSLSVSLNGEGEAPQGEVPETQDVNTAAESSPVADQGVKNAEEAKTEAFDPLAVTRKALETTAQPPDGEGATPGSDAKNESKSEGERPEGEGDVQQQQASKDDDDANLPFGKHPRFKQVLTERNEARRQIQELEPDARRYREVTSFMEANHLESAEVQTLFAFGAALKKGDVEEALRLGGPAINFLMQASGQTLPDDLRQRVEDGLVDEPSARELARSRAHVEATRNVREAEQRQAQARHEAQGREARINAANSYVEEQRSKDPDFALVEPLLDGAVQAALRRREQAGAPIMTPAHVREVMEDAYSQVKSVLKRASAPSQRGPVRNVPSGMSSSQPARRQAPTDPIEVTRMALGLT